MLTRNRTATASTIHTAVPVAGGRNPPNRIPVLPAFAGVLSEASVAGGRNPLFQKSTRKNQEFEKYLCDGQEPAILDATTSKYIPLSYFVTPNNPHSSSEEASVSRICGGLSEASVSRICGGLSEASAVGGRNPQRTPRRTSTRHTHGLADKMPYESFRLINLQQKGNHAHSLVLFKSRAITTNPENISIFECNGQLTQTEIRIIHTSHPSKNHDEDNDDEPGTVYDVSEFYFAPMSPRVCMNYGNHTYNPGYCGIFGIIAMTFFRNSKITANANWLSNWTDLVNYMHQDIPGEPQSHGSIGTNIAARVQEIIASHPSTHTGHQHAEQEIWGGCAPLRRRTTFDRPTGGFAPQPQHNESIMRA